MQNALLFLIHWLERYFDQLITTKKLRRRKFKGVYVEKINFGKKICLIVTVIGLSSFQATHAMSARSSSITKWGNCGGSSRSWWDDMCMAWRKKMGNYGWSQWWRNYGLVTIDRYVDADKASWGNDKWQFDGGDAALICTHGGSNDNGWYGTMHTKKHGECALNANQIIYGAGNGNGKMRFFHMSSCNSVRWQHRLKWFGAAQGRVHVITGFHGYMYIGSRYVSEYRKLASGGFSKGVGKVWMDKMHHVDHWYNAWKTICPISLGFGNTQSASANALNEKYHSKWSDKAPNWMTWRYYSKCDPNGGPRLPN